MEQEDTCSKYYNIIARAAIKKWWFTSQAINLLPQLASILNYHIIVSVSYIIVKQIECSFILEDSRLRQDYQGYFSKVKSNCLCERA